MVDIKQDRLRLSSLKKILHWLKYLREHFRTLYGKNFFQKAIGHRYSRKLFKEDLVFILF